MRVLVTGAGGLLGSAVAREFARSTTVVPFDRTHLDVTNADAVRAAIERERPDVVINCAAYNQVDAAEDHPRLALEVNAFATLALARASADVGAAFVHYSSDFVFDGETDRPYREAERANPGSVYGASKLLGDLFALEQDRAYVLRVESLFGPAAPGGRRGSLGTIVDGIREGREVPVFTDRVVSPSYTPHIAAATRHILETAPPQGLYHCVNSGSARWSEIAAYAAQTLGLPLRTRPVTLQTVTLRARRPRYCAMDNSKLRAVGYAMPPWQDALSEYLSADPVAPD
jgi:dTDP-4-dehydrorhamnose reductase